MTFATEIDKAASYRHTLVRITPARCVNDELTHLGSNVYSMTFNHPIDRITGASGTLFTEDASAPTVANHWYHNEATGELQIKTHTSPLADAGIWLVVHYHLFYSSVEVDTYETPTDSSSTVRRWEPRLMSEPRFQQALSDVFYGILSVQSSAVELANPDAAFHEHLGSAASFFNKALDCWIDVNGEVKKVFSGVVSEVTVDADTVRLTVHDVFDKLSSKALMGDTSDTDLFATIASYSDMAANYERTPKRYVFGKSRHATTDALNHGITTAASFNPYNSRVLDPDKTDVAIYTGVYETPGMAKNLGPYLLPFRVGSSGLKTLSFGTITAATVYRTDTGDNRYTSHQYGGGTIYKAMLVIENNALDHNLEVGDGFSFSHASLKAGATCYAVVMDVSGTYILCLVTSISVLASNVTVTGGTFNTTARPALAIWQPSGIVSSDAPPQIYPLSIDDYTLTTTTTAGGNKCYSVDLTDIKMAADLDGNYRHTGAAYNDPATWKVLVRISTAGDSRHDQALTTLLTEAGLTCDTTTFAAAGTALPVPVAFTIPSGTEKTYDEPYLTYAQLLLKSTMGYVKLNPMTDDEVEYELVAAPSSTNEITSDLILGDAPSASLDYRDIVTSITFVNDSVPIGYGGGDINFQYNGTTYTNAMAVLLHGTTNTAQHETVLCGSYHSGSTAADRFQEIVDIYSRRRATYRFRLATKLLDAKLGEDIQLTHDHVLGPASSVDLRIVTLNKSADEVVVEATDLEGI